tara:strand:- start:4372 stop:6909 length:2538 start_codon:yes stop_codon:yes gene_type:complete
MGLLIKLKNGDTPLKSLKFGNDRPGGGDSGQPYIKTPIEGQGVNTAIDGDSLIRGGLTAPTAALEDSTRLTKYLFDTKNPNGLLFTVKQNLLSRIAVKTEAATGPAYGGFSKEVSQGSGDISFSTGNGFINEGIYTPLSTIMQSQVGYLGQHLNKQGLDPTGEFPNASIKKYGDVVFKNNKIENNAHLPKVPLSLIKKEERLANRESRRKTQALLQQQRVNQEIERPATQLSNPIRRNSNPGVLSNINSFLSKWDAYRDKSALNRLERKEDNLQTTSNQLQATRDNRSEIENGRVVYDNKLLNLWDTKGLNRSDPKYMKGDTSILHSYNGGPNSILGVGKTDIKFATLNDGVTPYRTGVNFMDPYKGRYQLPIDRPIEYQTQNIFGSSDIPTTVTFKYLEGLKNQNPQIFPDYINSELEDSLFVEGSDEGFLIKYDGKGNIQPWASFNPYSTPTPKIPLYQLNNIFKGFPGSDKSVSLQYQKFLIENGAKPSSVDNLYDLFSESPEQFFKNKDNKPNIPWDDSKDENVTSYQFGGTGGANDKSISHYRTWGFDDFTDNTINSPLNTTPSINKPAFQNQLNPGVGSGGRGRNRYISFSPDYTLFNQEKRIGLGRDNDPGEKGNISNYVEGKKRYGKVLKAVDEINALPIQSSPANSQKVNDFIHFNIAIHNTFKEGKKYCYFRSFIEDFNDSFSAKWDNITYVGRGEKLFKYSGFNRSISLNFKVVALSKPELIPMYRKLNFIASSLAPNYSSDGFMGGNIAELSFGGYIKRLPGIITSFKISPPKDTTWEVAIPLSYNDPSSPGVAEKFSDNSVRELPHMVDVSLTFEPIHKFRPEIGKKFILNN